MAGPAIGTLGGAKGDGQDAGAGQGIARLPSQAMLHLSAIGFRGLCQGEGSNDERTTQETNKALVLEAFDSLINKRDYEAAQRYWSTKYIQHSAHIAPGREGLFNLIKSMPPTLKYKEPGVIVAESDLVILHGRFSGFGAPVNWIAADILRIEDGILIEHWDVIQDESDRNDAIQERWADVRRPHLGMGVA